MYSAKPHPPLLPSENRDGWQQFVYGIQITPVPGKNDMTDPISVRYASLINKPEVPIVDIERICAEICAQNIFFIRRDNYAVCVRSLLPFRIAPPACMRHGMNAVFDKIPAQIIYNVHIIVSNTQVAGYPAERIPNVRFV